MVVDTQTSTDPNYGITEYGPPKHDIICYVMVVILSKKIAVFCTPKNVAGLYVTWAKKSTQNCFQVRLPSTYLQLCAWRDFLLYNSC